MVAERTAVEPVDLTRQRRPFATLDLTQRAEDLHARLRELGLELLEDRRVQVESVVALTLVPEHLLDLDADGEVGELRTDDRVVGEGRPPPRRGLAVPDQLVEHPGVARRTG